MKSIVQNATYGEIVYEESFWTGKKMLSINGTKLKKTNKTTFTYANGDQNVSAVLQGNYLSGTKLCIGNETVQVTPALKWYEILLSVLIFALILVWGNSVTLCQIIPVVGGAVGGGISGLMALVNLLAMKSVKNPWLKVLVWALMIAATFLICFAIAEVIISAKS